MVLPAYVDLPGSSTYPPPYTLSGLNQQAFVLRASYERLTSLTDHWLNSVPGSEYRFVPLLPFVICSPIWIDRVVPADPEWAKKGWMHETDFNFGYFVACFRGLEFDHVALALPYLVVDNPVTTAAGREVYGYRKVFGSMEYVAGTYQPVAARTWVFKAFSPQQELWEEEVARILSPPAWGAATRQANWEDLKQLAELAAGDLAIDAGVAVARLIDLLRGMQLRNVFLLELRDVAAPASAGYQALIEASMTLTSFNSAWFLAPGFAVKLTDYPSYPIISDLGIEVDRDNVAQSLLSFQLNYDCMLDTGTVLAVAKG
jgi:hypothetical protein